MDAASVAWILTATALVLLMFPGLAMLYGGMLSGRSVINMMMMVMSSLAVTTVVYVIVGHGLVLGSSVGGLGLIGDPLDFSFSVTSSATTVRAPRSARHSSSSSPRSRSPWSPRGPPGA
jgi:ammonia channel protein AmtB